MTLLEEVKAFARDFVNGNRTNERLIKVRSAYRQITGNNLRITCSTCYIEAIFTILKYMEKKPCRYELKKGAILQPFGGGIVTNENLTDAIAEECLRTVRGAASLFAKMPVPEPETVLDIVPVTDAPAETLQPDSALPATDKPATDKPADNKPAAAIKTAQPKKSNKKAQHKKAKK